MRSRAPTTMAAALCRSQLPNRSREKFMDVCEVKLSDVDDSLSRSMTTKQTPAHRCTMSVSLEFERSPICMLSSTSEMSLMECGHPGNFLFTWSRMGFHEVITVAEKIENTVQPVFSLDFHTSTIEDIDHVALWLALLDEVRQPVGHAPNCSVTDCDWYNVAVYEMTTAAWGIERPGLAALLCRNLLAQVCPCCCCSFYHVSSMGWRDWNDGCGSVWQSRSRPRKQKRAT